MLVLISISTMLWGQISCNQNVHDSTQLEGLFLKKYSAGYQPWKELEDITFSIMEEVCKTSSQIMSKSNNESMTTGAGEKLVRTPYGLKGHKDTKYELDVISCSVSLFQGDSGNEETEEFYLTEGDEPRSAFQFIVEDSNIVLKRKIKDVWPKPEYVLDDE